MPVSSWIANGQGSGPLNREELRKELVSFAQTSVGPLLEESFTLLSERVAAQVVETLAQRSDFGFHRPTYDTMGELQHDLRLTNRRSGRALKFESTGDQDDASSSIERLNRLSRNRLGRQESPRDAIHKSILNRSNTDNSLTYSAQSDPVPGRRPWCSGSESKKGRDGGQGWSLKHLPPRVQMETDSKHEDDEEELDAGEPEALVRRTGRAYTLPTPGSESSKMRDMRVHHINEELEDGHAAGEPLVGDMTGLTKRRGQKTFYDHCRKLVMSSAFEHAIGFLVVMNAGSLGSATDFWARHPREDSHPFIFEALEVFFCCVFTLEWLLRVYVHGSSFFTMEGRRWHLFDTLMLACQLLEQGISKYCVVNLSILRLLRILRVVRIARLVRVLHLVDELRVIVRSLVNSSHTLVWSFVLLGITVYIFSVAFLRIVLDAGDTPHKDEIHYYFASLYRACLTMFECIVGGQSWDVVVSPLMEDISPFLGILFCIYISACLFAMMNLLTGIFVENAMRTVREDKDMSSAAKIRDLFLTRDTHPDEDAEEHEITWETFSSKLETAAMQDYFKQINVEISEARNLFDLIDADGSGSVDSKEIVDGCLKLRGPARALEMAILMKESGKTYEQVSNFQESAAQALRDIREDIAKLSRMILAA